MKTPTIYDIKYRTLENQFHFFDRDTLKFFGQTMKDFRVKKSPTGRIFILATMYYDTNYAAGYTFREFVNNNLITPRNDDGTAIKCGCYDLDEIYDYIKSH